MSLFRKMIDSQTSLSSAFDQLLSEKYIVDGNRHFLDIFAPKYITSGLKIYDVGGGKNPYISQSKRKVLDLTVIGLDISAQELNRAPENAYDQIICADIAQFRGKGDADLVICQALLEHVKNVDKAFESIASILRPGGKALIFVPSRNAAFARLNLILPEKLKRRLLYAVFPNTRESQGFVSYYDRCTPRHFRSFARKYDFKVIEERYYFKSFYFSFFFPLHFIWRLWGLLFQFMAGNEAAETFSIALEKNRQIKTT